MIRERQRKPKYRVFVLSLGVGDDASYSQRDFTGKYWAESWSRDVVRQLRRERPDAELYVFLLDQPFPTFAELMADLEVQADLAEAAEMN